MQQNKTAATPPQQTNMKDNCYKVDGHESNHYRKHCSRINSASRFVLTTAIDKWINEHVSKQIQQEPAQGRTVIVENAAKWKAVSNYVLALRKMQKNKTAANPGSAHCDLEVAVEVRQCPLGSGARGGGPAVPTGIWSSRLRSGSAHCDLEVAVEVRQCPLRSATRGWSPAVPTGIWSSRWRSSCAHWDLDCEEEAAGEEAEEEEKSSVKI